MALTPGLVYTAAITTGAKDTEGTGLIADHEWSFTTILAAPIVVSTSPLDGATGLPVESSINATFDKSMDAATITAAGTFTVKQGLTDVAGTVTFNAATNTATFTPTVALTPGLVYTAEITTGAKDTEGTGLIADHDWSFATVSAAPIVAFTNPLSGATDVAVNTIITATFSDAMDAATVTAAGTFAVMQGVNPIPGVVTYNASTNTATFTPSAPLLHNVVHTATVTTSAKDTHGVGLVADHVWSFTTAPAPPTITAVNPQNNATGVATNAVVTATFNKAMDAATITAAGTFTVKQGLTPVSGVVTYNATTRVATFNPDASLEAGLVYTATVSTGAEDAGGMALAADYVWFFAIDVAPTITSTSPPNGVIEVPIDVAVDATFDKAMDGATITNLTFTLEQGITPVTGVVTYDGLTNTATLTPDASLTPGLVYTATVTTGATSSTGIPIASDHVWSFTIDVAPTITSTDPINGATEVSIDTAVDATFDKAMDGATITDLTFTLEQGITPVTGVVTYDELTSTATLTPDASLTPGLVYTATVTTGVMSSAGIPIVADYVWTFTTDVAPTVTVTNPLNAATGVALNSIVTATFSEAMNPVTITDLTFTVDQGLTSVSGVVTYDGLTNTATFTPDADLDPNLEYTATVTTGAEDAGGTPLEADYVWTFTTVLPPTVTSNTPLNNAVEVSIMNQPTATFSTSMDGATITAPGTFILDQAGTPVSGTVTYDGLSNTATFVPDAPLGLNLPYTATVTTAAENSGGTPLAADHVWTFTTAACSLEPVDLGSAANFAVLGGSTITNVVSVGTSVTGDVGLSPGTAVTGFPPGVIVGTLHVNDPIAAAAQADLTTAYNDAAGRTLCPVTLSGANLGGMTLTPGLYWSGTSLEISSGDLYLDAEGDENAVFIFQMASTFTTTSGRQVILQGGAKASNIFWQVGSSATLGTTSHMEGTILADQSITLETGATLNGRALARIGAVSLDASVIVAP